MLALLVVGGALAVLLAPHGPAATVSPEGTTSFAGTGATTLTVTDASEPATVLAHLTHNGTGRFTVVATGEGREAWAAVDVVGPYDGTVVLDPGGLDRERVRVETDGEWAVDLVPLDSVPTMAQTLSGSGDAVARWDGAAGGVSITYDGTMPVTVACWDPATGRYATLYVARPPARGRLTLPDGPVYVAVQGDGPWEITEQG